MHVFGDVGVDVERDLDVGVAEHLLDLLGMGSGPEGECCERVAEVVKADRRQAGLADGKVERPADIVGVEHPAGHGREHQAALSPPRTG